ncbi:hypothetical protein L1280_002805 [Deinococcus sp. HSC-46F16]|uniref:hypothetical protein n=1 Tax=Deinococcus sp. HSC-46F16 TaxID=2910968 RepID=UPI00209C9123|nr:hypothetical protein [Deinococcus sp. HSC-46F16]MCP2015637.1 hypothetical protein [Deinococcus sp. HSC-46F16]
MKQCRCCGFHDGRHWNRCQHWRPPAKYRWLTEGQTYRYSAAIGKGDDTRRGTTCTVVTVPRAGAKPANVLVRWLDGHTAIVPSGVLRKVAL